MAVPDNSSVRWFHNDMANAPQINAQAGDLINILDACLLDGFDPRSPDGDKITISDEVATVQFSGGHDFDRWAVIEISGATPSALNDVWRITSTTVTTFTFDCPGLADGTATGAITVKRATPGYWEKAFSDTHKAAYRSLHPNASQLYLRIDDSLTGTSSSQVRGYEAMTDIDTGTRPFPTFAQAANMVWRRSNTTSGASLPRPWTLVADEGFIWFFVDWQSGSNRASMYQFGDIARFNAADVYSCVIGAHAVGSPSFPAASYNGNDFSGTLFAGCYFARPESGAAIDPLPYRRYGSRITQYPGDGPDFPNPNTGGYLFHYPVLVASIQNEGRGLLPGGMQSLTERTNTLNSDLRRLLAPSEAFSRPVLVIEVTGGTSFASHFAVDIGGPWR